jgi:diapolycopene oxygenase
MRMGSTVAGTVRAFNPDPRVAQMIDHYTQYVGSSPYGSPAVLCGIAHMQTDEGVWYPMGGTRAVPVALEKLARELGVEFRLNTKIEKVIQCNGAGGRRAHDSGEEVPLRAVVSNSDSGSHPSRTHQRRRRHAKFENRRGYEAACSGVVLYLGLKKRYDHLAHHDFVFSRDPHEEFEWIYKKGEPAPDPTCYLAATTCSETATAPAGGEALYVLVHTPYLRPHHDWKKMLPAYRKHHHREAQAHRANAGPRRPHRVRERADAAGHQRSLSRA